MIRAIFIYRSIGPKTIYEHVYLIGGDFGYYRTLAWWLMTPWHCILHSHFSFGKREHSMCTKEQTRILTCATESTQKTALVYIVPLQENHFEFSTCWGSNPWPSQSQTLFCLKLMRKHKFGQVQCNLRKNYISAHTSTSRNPLWVFDLLGFESMSRQCQTLVLEH